MRGGASPGAGTRRHRRARRARVVEAEGGPGGDGERVSVEGDGPGRVARPDARDGLRDPGGAAAAEEEDSSVVGGDRDHPARAEGEVPDVGEMEAPAAGEIVEAAAADDRRQGPVRLEGPDPHELVVARRRDRVAVGAHRDAVDVPRVLHPRGAEGPPGPHVPRGHGPVRAAGDERGASAREGEAVDHVAGGEEAGPARDGAPAADRPEPDARLVAPLVDPDGELPVRRPGDAPGVVLREHDRLRARAAGGQVVDAPDLGAAGVARRREVAAVGAERETVDGAERRRSSSSQLAGARAGERPERDPSVVVPGGEQPPVRAERDGVHVRRHVQRPQVTWLPRPRDVPEVDRLVVSPRRGDDPRPRPGSHRDRADDRVRRREQRRADLVGAPVPQADAPVGRPGHEQRRPREERDREDRARVADADPRQADVELQRRERLAPRLERRGEPAERLDARQGRRRRAEPRAVGEVGDPLGALDRLVDAALVIRVRPEDDDERDGEAQAAGHRDREPAKGQPPASPLALLAALRLERVSLRLLLLRPQLRPLGVLPLLPPAPDRPRERVVEDLVRRLVARIGERDGTEDVEVAGRQPPQHRLEPRLRELRHLRELPHGERDLRPARGDEVAERRGGRALLVRRELGHRPREVRLRDRLGAAEALERLEPEDVGPLGRLLVPQPLQHELQVGRLDRLRARAGVGAVAVRPAVLRDDEAVPLHLVEDGVDERRLDGHARPVLLVVALDRLQDRLARAVAVQVVEVQEVRVDVREPPAEEVAEPGVRVLANRDEEACAEVGALHARGELVGERILPLVPRAVEEVLLELVEDHQQGAVGRRGRGGLDRALDVVARQPGALVLREQSVQRLLDRRREAEDGIPAPRAEDDRDEARRPPRRRVVRGLPPEACRDPGAEQRALADAALRVEQREPRRAEVADDDAGLRVAAEEEVGVVLRVVGQPDVGTAQAARRLGLRGAAHVSGPARTTRDARRGRSRTRRAAARRARPAACSSRTPGRGRRGSAGPPTTCSARAARRSAAGTPAGSSRASSSRGRGSCCPSASRGSAWGRRTRRGCGSGSRCSRPR